MELWLAAICLAGSIAAAPAAASSTQESIVQDDPLVLGARTQAVTDQAFRTFKAFGVDRVRVSLFWNHVAPANRSQRRPRFARPGAWWPGSYPRGSWDRYDKIVLAAAKAGIGLLFSPTGPAPAWATPGRQREEGDFRPNTSEFRDFVRAAAIRYSGAYPIGADPPPPARETRRLVIGGFPVGPGEPPPPGNPRARLPRVDHWSIWNEPNYPSWLAPVWLNNNTGRATKLVPVAPAQYRGLVDAAYASLVTSGQSRRTILIGETAPRGARQLGNSMAPREFVRELYCLKRNLRPYSGREARTRNCPATAARRRRFRAAHPGLFRTGGFAVHPYSLDGRHWRRPTWHHPNPDNVSIGNLPSMIRTLDRVKRKWGSRQRFKIWITEYGYQTHPPDPLAGVSPASQGPLTAWGEYLAFRMRRVVSMAQFLVYDATPLRANTVTKRWLSWQSGLYSAAGREKPFAHDYQYPLHIEQRGRSVRVFSAMRPDPNGTPLIAHVEFTPGRTPFTKIAEQGVANPRNYLSTRATVPGPGLLRVAWFDRAGKKAYTSAVKVR